MGCRSPRYVVVLLWLAAVALASCGGGSLSGPSSATSRTFTVMTFNIQHGLDSAGRYRLQGAIDVIARLQPDLVGLQEVTRNHPFYNCEDQPERLRSGVQQATGRSWSVVYEREWFTPDRTCLDRGVGNDVETEGLAILAPESLIGTQSLPLANTRLGLVARTGIVPVPVVVTQLASGAAGIGDRAAQVSQLLPWAAALGTPRILMGDMNAQPVTGELTSLAGEYRDAWADAMAAGLARGVITGDTRVRGGRIDYVFYAGGPAVELESAEIVDTTALLGVTSEVSDHRPVLVRFRLR
jgi:endonuclease/exonuclease/phosphatase family metal-dependent hydrolase